MRRGRICGIGFLAAAALLLGSCAGMPWRWSPGPQTAELLRSPRLAWPAYPAVRFAVASDLHYFDPSLGTTGPDFLRVAAASGKMFAESGEILDEAIGTVRESGVRFLLVPGDLTKDGERVDHEAVARLLGALVSDGIGVYVVPGNHDILNPHAVRFTEHGPERVATVDAGEFAAIYQDCGYGQAIARDSGSLSYVAEPAQGLWLLGIDACRYSGNMARGSPETRGRLEPGTMRWIEARLADAAWLGKRVIAFMHHGVLEHFRGEKRYAGMYLVDDNRDLAGLLEAWGVQVVFTGHFHAQDVVRSSGDGGSVLYDVETGSLVTTPVPIRIVETDGDGRMSITTRRVANIPSLRATGGDLQEHALALARGAAISVATTTMLGYGVPRRDAEALAPQIAEASLAHLRGDEHFAGGRTLGTRGLSLMGRLVVGGRANLIDELWNDPPPDDNDVILDVRPGR